MKGNILKLLLIQIFIFMVVGCSAEKHVIPKAVFTVAADVRNDVVQGVTPQIEQVLLNNYLSDKKVQRQRDDFKKVVNSTEVSGGTAFLVRTKNGFSTYFMDELTKKVQFVAGWESQVVTDSSNPGGCSLLSIPDQNNELTKKIIVGVFNFAQATRITITWHNGQQTTHNLTNGTIIIEPKNNEYTITQWEVFDSSDKSLYKQEVTN